MFGKPIAEVCGFQNRIHTPEMVHRGSWHMLCVSEIHSTVRVRVEQIHNICHEPTHKSIQTFINLS